MKEVQVDNEEAAFEAVKDEVDRLHAAGYKNVDVRTGRDSDS